MRRLSAPANLRSMIDATRILVGVVLLVTVNGCGNECDDRPPPCVDESFYSFEWPAEPEHPLGPAVVEYNGRDSVGFVMDDTDELTYFRLPVQPALEPGDAVTIDFVEGDGGGYLVSHAGEPSFFVGSGPYFYGPSVVTVAGIDMELVEYCREPSVDGQCFYGTTVYALDVGGVLVEPGAIREVELPDGRGATLHNQVVNRGTSSCRRCLDLPRATFLVTVVFDA